MLGELTQFLGRNREIAAKSLETLDEAMTILEEQGFRAFSENKQGLPRRVEREEVIVFSRGTTEVDSVVFFTLFVTNKGEMKFAVSAGGENGVDVLGYEPVKRHIPYGRSQEFYGDGKKYFFTTSSSAEKVLMLNAQEMTFSVISAHEDGGTFRFPG